MESTQHTCQPHAYTVNSVARRPIAIVNQIVNAVARLKHQLRQRTNMKPRSTTQRRRRSRNKKRCRAYYKRAVRHKGTSMPKYKRGKTKLRQNKSRPTKKVNQPARRNITTALLSMIFVCALIPTVTITAATWMTAAQTAHAFYVRCGKQHTLNNQQMTDTSTTEADHQQQRKGQPHAHHCHLCTHRPHQRLHQDPRPQCRNYTKGKLQAPRELYSLPAASSRNPKSLRFDTNSFIIGIDNCASTHVTNTWEHFIKPPQWVATKVKTFDGSKNVKWRGEVRWALLDDNSKRHVFHLSEMYYSERVPFCLLSPQKWAQQAGDNYPRKNGTRCITNADDALLQWEQRRYKRTVPVSETSNVFTFYSAPSNDAANDITTSSIKLDLFQQFAQDKRNGADDLLRLRDKNRHRANTLQRRHFNIALPSVSNILPQYDHEQGKPGAEHFRTDGGDHSAHVEPDIQWPSESVELLYWHYRLGHISFRKLQEMAAQDILPRRLAHCRVPKCACCLLGKATRRAWRTKTPPNTIKVRPITKAGDVVSVNQIVLPVDGFVGQTKGALTRHRYKGATVFVDHWSSYTYVYLHKRMDAEDLLLAKRSFERLAASHGVRVRHYHADNGVFADSHWTADCVRHQQTTSFCGVNAHFQNGKAERKIGLLQESARTMLIHTSRNWKGAYSPALWPYALRHAATIATYMPASQKLSTTPLSLFTNTAVQPQPKHLHTFGCPIYVLHAAQASGKKGPKWSDRARVRVYLGESLSHARSVALVLSLTTGLVSSQFHVAWDDYVRHSASGQPVPTSPITMATKSGLPHGEYLPSSGG